MKNSNYILKVNGKFITVLVILVIVWFTWEVAAQCSLF